MLDFKPYTLRNWTMHVHITESERATYFTQNSLVHHNFCNVDSNVCTYQHCTMNE